jgi:hypothetical protein
MSDNSQDAAFKEDMEQASLLPGHDPVRAAVVDRVAAVGGEEGPAGREWLSLLEESERLKLALVTVPVPEGLEAKLLRLPDLASSSPLPWYKRPAGEILTPRRLSIAAAVMLVVGLGWWAYSVVAAHREAVQAERVALLAANIHTTILKQAPAEQITTDRPDEAHEWLKKRVDFPVHLLSGRGPKLTGAGVVQLGTATAALTRWEGGGQQFSLLEFVPASVGLPDDFSQRTTEATPTTPYKVVMWSEPNLGCGWALVMEPSATNTFTY